METQELPIFLGLSKQPVDRVALTLGYALISGLAFLLANIEIVQPRAIQGRHRVVEVSFLRPVMPDATVPKKIEESPSLSAHVPMQSAPIPAPHPIELAKRQGVMEAPKLHVNQSLVPQMKFDVAAVQPKLLHIGDFTSSSVAAPPKAALKKVEIGKFGDPNGVKGQYSLNSQLNPPQMGSFDTEGNLPAQSRGPAVGVTVAKAGFGGEPIMATGYRGNGTVSVGSFGTEQKARDASRMLKASIPETTPVEIISKPQPAYTAEARSLKLEGEVLLEVMFKADGSLHVNRIVRGLGHGLDESAVAAALKIRFKPELRTGQPVDSTEVVHVVFQMT